MAVGPVKGVLLRRVRKSQCGTFYQSTCIPLSGGLHSQHISTLRPFLYIARSFVRSFVRAVGCERRLRSRRASLKGRFRGPRVSHVRRFARYKKLYRLHLYISAKLLALTGSRIHQLPAGQPRDVCTH